MTKPEIAAHGSHFPVLAALACKSFLRGLPVLELGCGAYSTPLLRMLAQIHRGQVLAAETAPEWQEAFADLIVPTAFEIERVTDWDRWDGYDRHVRWGCVLVDHAPGERRVVEIERLAMRAQWLVVHDTEDEAGPRASPLWQKAPKGGGNYNYGPTFAKFKHVWHWGRFRPDTTVLSNFEACPL